MAHAQVPDFVFQRNGRVHLNRQVRLVQSTTGSRSVRISGSNAGYTMFRGSVKSTGYPLHSPISPSLPLPCVTVCHHVSTGLYIAEDLNSQLNRYIYLKSCIWFRFSWFQRLCLTLRRLMSYIYGAPILNVSRSHTTTQHSR